MQDRNVEFPQRYRIQKVEGTDDIYDLIPTPGEIGDEGTLINKTSLLKDATAALFGLGTDAVPDDALKVLSRFHAGMGNEHMWARSDGSYVNSPNANDYPPAVDDGYTYEYLGQLGEKVRIAAGSYKGTGEATKTITTGFAPKFFSASFTSGWNEYTYLFANGTQLSQSANAQTRAKVTISSTSITFSIAENMSYMPMNNSGATYYYVAIG